MWLSPLGISLLDGSSIADKQSAVKEHDADYAGDSEFEV